MSAAIWLYFLLSFSDRIKKVPKSPVTPTFAPTLANTPRLSPGAVWTQTHNDSQWQFQWCDKVFVPPEITYTFDVLQLWCYQVLSFFSLVWDLYQRCTRHHFSQPQCLSLCLLMAGMECLSAPLVPTGKKKKDMTPSINNVSFPSHFSQIDWFLNLIRLLISYLKMCPFFVAFVFQKVLKVSERSSAFRNGVLSRGRSWWRMVDGVIIVPWFGGWLLKSVRSPKQLQDHKLPCSVCAVRIISP